MRSLAVSLWFVFLTFPIVVIRISPVNGEIIWRFQNAVLLGTGVFLLSFVWRALLVWKGISTAQDSDLAALFIFLKNTRNKDRCIGLGLLVAGCLPLLALMADLLTGGGKTTSGIVPLLLSGGAALAASCGAACCFYGKRQHATTLLRSYADKAGKPGAMRALLAAAAAVVLLLMPFAMDMYQINVMASTFIWIMLGLGLNIVVGHAGLLVLGYVAFYAVGAYAYAVVNANFGNDYVGFWLMLPLGGFLAATAGILLSLPVLRLRGDYLAIVTLGFGEIIRIILEGGSISLAPVGAFISLFTEARLPAWMFTPLDLGGPAGISNIPYPGFFGMKLGIDASIHFVYYIALALVILTAAAVARLRDSRIGRSWLALREDETACEAMGINTVSAKLSAFALGACWAGFGGVLFAAKTTFINTTSFTFMESALILSVVVLGGLGSILGVALGACILILLPEYLRSFNEYRMLIFGASMVLMMVFRPQGLITPGAKKRSIAAVNGKALHCSGKRLQSGSGV
jgi:branched-chain amino acid transport system permease protein